MVVRGIPGPCIVVDGASSPYCLLLPLISITLPRRHRLQQLFANHTLWYWHVATGKIVLVSIVNLVYTDYYS